MVVEQPAVNRLVQPEAEALLALQCGEPALAAAWCRRLTKEQLRRTFEAARKLMALVTVHLATDDCADEDG